MGDVLKRNSTIPGREGLRRIDHSDPLPAWEMIEEGRYRPIRTRGSFPGRELG